MKEAKTNLYLPESQSQPQMMSQCGLGSGNSGNCFRAPMRVSKSKHMALCLIHGHKLSVFKVLIGNLIQCAAPNALVFLK